jgi:hypothetical protein
MIEALQMDTQTMTLALAAVNTLVLPALFGLGRYAFSIEKRLMHIEYSLQLRPGQASAARVPQ